VPPPRRRDPVRYLRRAVHPIGAPQRVLAGVSTCQASPREARLCAQAGECCEAGREVPGLVRAQQGPCHRQSAGIAGPWFITPHAVQRYRERCPGKLRLTYEQALGELVRLSAEARFVKRLPTGCDLWRGRKPLRLRMYVAHDNPGKPQLVTVKRGFEKLVDCPNGKLD